MVCRICGNKNNNINHMVKERIINNGAVFKYLECSKCGTLMLDQKVENIEQWYPDNYNPFKKSIKNSEKLIIKLKRKIIFEFIIRNANEMYFQKVLTFKYLDILLKRLYGTNIKSKYSILDVGCASGHWLDLMYEMGYKNLTGVDLYYPNSNSSDKKWRFVKGDIFTINNKKYDLITLNHSFEHMENPLDVLFQVKNLLSNKGTCVISIPLKGGIAWKMFGVDFCQIDAPRHIYLYTEKSMKYLCNNVGLCIEKILYDSHGKILSLSSAYKKTSKSHRELIQNDGISLKMKTEYEKMAKESNFKHEGDQAIFYIKIKK